MNNEQNTIRDDQDESSGRCKTCGAWHGKRIRGDAPSKCLGIASVFILLGELLAQSRPDTGGWHTFSDNAIDGLSKLCIDFGYELHETAEPMASWVLHYSENS